MTRDPLRRGLVAVLALAALAAAADIPPARQWHEPVLGTLTITRIR